MHKTWTSKQGKWIWLAGEEKPLNAFVQFRKPFTLDKIPSYATIHVSADCRYLLYINGVIIGRGPVTTNPKFKQTDEYDTLPYLRKGENVIGAYVLQRHTKNSRYWPVRGGFLLELEMESLLLGTDSNWKARWAVESKPDTPLMTHQNGHQEWLDGRMFPLGWHDAGFNDKEWQNAVEVTNSHQFWPTALEVRTVPFMLREIIYPIKVISWYGIASHPSLEMDHEPARQLETDYVMSSVIGWNTDNLIHPEKGPAVFQENVGDGVGLVVDLGEEMYGFPYIDIECPAGITVDIGHGEVLSRNRIQTVLFPDSPAEQRYADRYITREGRQRFEVYEHKGCRYLQVHFRRIPKHESGGSRITVHEVGFVRSRTPIEHQTEFSCSDELINQIFDVCRRTAQVICQDWHICDAQREQNNFVEMYQDMVMWQVFGKVEMLRQTIDMFARDQLPSGFILSTIPTIDNRALIPENQYIFTTYAFTMTVYLDWLYGGLDERHIQWIDHCDKAFNGLLAFLSSNGVLENTPGNHWAEWTALDARPGECGRPVKKSWEVTFFCNMLILAMERMADMAEFYGRNKIAQQWRTQATKIRSAANERYWSEDRQAYVDGIYDNQPSDTISQSTNALAMLARLGNIDRLKAVAKTILDNTKFDVESGINNMAMLHEALESVDCDQVVPDRIRTKWKKMLDLGATTTWESFSALEVNNGCCFGFGAHPLNYIVRNFLGIVPLKAGHQTFSVRIAPHNLKYGKGKVATPFGLIEVLWQYNSSDCISVELTIPNGCEAHVAMPRLLTVPEFNKAILNGQYVNLELIDIASCTFLQHRQLGFILGPGKHEITFQR